MQGLAPKLIGTVLSSWTGLLDSHLCCSRCRSLFIWVHNTRHAIHTPPQPSDTLGAHFQQLQQTLNALGHWCHRGVGSTHMQYLSYQKGTSWRGSRQRSESGKAAAPWSSLSARPSLRRHCGWIGLLKVMCCHVRLPRREPRPDANANPNCVAANSAV